MPSVAKSTTWTQAHLYFTSLPKCPDVSQTPWAINSSLMCSKSRSTRAISVLAAWSTCPLLSCSSGSQVLGRRACALWPVHDHTHISQVLRISSLSLLHFPWNPLTACSISCMMPGGDPPFEQPANPRKLRCKNHLCFSTKYLWRGSNSFTGC